MSLSIQKVEFLEQITEINARKHIKRNFKHNLQTLTDQIKDKNVESNVCIPIAFVSNDLSKFVNAKCRIIRLSKDTLSKQLHKHPEIMRNGIFSYDNIQKLIDCGLVIKEGRNNYKRVILFIGELTVINYSTKWFKLAIKATKQGDELYLTSLHPINPKLKENIVDNGELIRTHIKEARSYKYIFGVIIILFVCLALLAYQT